MKWLYAFLIATLIILGAKAENDTATSTNILPNAGTTSSNMDNFNLDGVNSGTGNLSNNSTHNGFTITCGTTVGGHCGKAFNGELESSRDMKVGASGTLIDIDGVEAGTTYTSTQNKLDGGIHLNSYFSVQNCEDGSSSFSCGQSSGADDSYNLHVKIKDANGNTLAEMTTTRLNDAGYNSNSAKFHDNLVWNGTGAASYEWYWQGFDGQQSTSALRGPNLLGAELLLDFPIDDHEPLTLEERTVINEALNTTELTENEIYDIISGLESMIEEEFFASGNLEEGARVELSIEESGLTFEIASKETGAIVMEAPIAQEMFAPIMEAMPIETLKEEMVAMVQEEMPFMEIIEELSPPAAMEEPQEMKEEEPTPIATGPVMEEEAPKEEEPKAMAAGPMLTAPPQEKEETNSKEPATMEVASAPKKETPQTSKKETSVVKEKNEREEKKEPEEKESNSEAPATSVVSKQDNTKQKKVQSKKAVKPKLEKVMAKVDEKIKNPLKNLQLKNLLKMDAMVDNQLSLDSYNVAFYAPKDIYLEQLNLIDNRIIYANKSLATYIQNDKIEIKAKKLGEINLKKQQLLNELEILKNGQT